MIEPERRTLGYHLKHEQSRCVNEQVEVAATPIIVAVDAQDMILEDSADITLPVPQTQLLLNPRTLLVARRWAYDRQMSRYCELDFPQAARQAPARLLTPTRTEA